jgi:hypothetical protein
VEFPFRDISHTNTPLGPRRNATSVRSHKQSTVKCPPRLPLEQGVGALRALPLCAASVQSPPRALVRPENRMDRKRMQGSASPRSGATLRARPRFLHVSRSERRGERVPWMERRGERVPWKERHGERVPWRERRGERVGTLDGAPWRAGTVLRSTSAALLVLDEARLVRGCVGA